MHDHEHSHDVEVKKVDRISSTQVRLTIAFSGKTVAEHEKMTAAQYTHKASLPGFRPGKAPLKMVLERFRDRIRQDVVSHLLEAGLHEALHKTKLSPVSRPRIELGKFSFAVDEPLEFHAEFEVEPEIEIRSYKGVPLKAVDSSAPESEVDRTIETLRERLGVLEPSESLKPGKGSFAVVEVGYALIDDPKKGEAPKVFTVELGNGQLIPEIDDALMQMSVGENRQVQGTFPKPYQDKDLEGKTATFDCKIVELKKRTLPELNDAFAETVRPGSTLAALREDIQKNIATSKVREGRRVQRQQVVDYLVKKNPFDVPRGLVDLQTRKLLESMAQDFKTRGQGMPPLKDEEMKAVLGSAEEIVRGGLLLKSVAQKEKIELSETKFKERVSELAQQWNQTPEQAETFLQQQGVLDRIRDEILTDQIFDFLIENAKVEK